MSVALKWIAVGCLTPVWACATSTKTLGTKSTASYVDSVPVMPRVGHVVFPSVLLHSRALIKTAKQLVSPLSQTQPPAVKFGVTLMARGLGSPAESSWWSRENDYVTRCKPADSLRCKDLAWPTPTRPNQVVWDPAADPLETSDESYFRSAINKQMTHMGELNGAAIPPGAEGLANQVVELALSEGLSDRLRKQPSLESLDAKDALIRASNVFASVPDIDAWEQELRTVRAAAHSSCPSALGFLADFMFVFVVGDHDDGPGIDSWQSRWLRTAITLGTSVAFIDFGASARKKELGRALKQRLAGFVRASPDDSNEMPDTGPYQCHRHGYTEETTASVSLAIRVADGRWVRPRQDNRLYATDLRPETHDVFNPHSADNNDALRPRALWVCHIEDEDGGVAALNAPSQVVFN